MGLVGPLELASSPRVAVGGPTSGSSAAPAAIASELSALLLAAGLSRVLLPLFASRPPAPKLLAAFRSLVPHAPPTDFVPPPASSCSRSYAAMTKPMSAILAKNTLTLHAHNVLTREDGGLVGRRVGGTVGRWVGRGSKTISGEN